VTVLTRESSNASLPSGVSVKKVDYKSVESIKPALEGQDAVVSVLGTFASGEQQPLADAAFEAGVKRFIPSEFGINTRRARGTAMGKLIGTKIALVDDLIEKSKKNPSFTWTGISVGLFFDSVRKPVKTTRQENNMLIPDLELPQALLPVQLQDKDGYDLRLR
jgi:hypothetical protein